MCNISEARRLTTCCGLWCGDCVPYQHELFEEARKFRSLLEKYHYREYAATKPDKAPIYANYAVFEDILDYIIREECTVQCFEGPCSEVNCSPDCAIKQCASEKGLAGCWECDYRACPQISSMLFRHPDVYHSLDMLKKHGIEGWSDYRGAHHPWQTCHCGPQK